MTNKTKQFQDYPDKIGELDKRKLSDNFKNVFLIVSEAASAKALLSKELLADWHTRLFLGVSYIPHPCYLGGFRGSTSHPWLTSYETSLRQLPAAKPHLVSTLVEKIIAQINNSQVQTTDQIIDLAADIYSQWIYVYPFCNGNARMSRLITDYVLMRNNLPPVFAYAGRPPRPDYGKNKTNPSGAVKNQMKEFFTTCLEGKS